MADFLAGQIVDEGQMNRLRPQKYTIAPSGSLTMNASTTETDIPGCSVTIVTEFDGALYEVDAAFEALVTTISTTTIMIGKLNIDGVTDANQEATYGMDVADRDIVTQHWDGVLATAGSHTFKLRGNLSAAAGVGAWNVSNTYLRVKITEQA